MEDLEVGERAALGCLYGVGVGPGDPELLTLRARRVLRQVPVICVPQASDRRDSIALGIVREYLDPAQEYCGAVPYQQCRRRSGSLAGNGQDSGQPVGIGTGRGFLTEGDPTLYSTFSYVAAGVAEICPGATVRMVPGVSSVTAAAARAVLPLGAQRERVAVLPAVYGIDDLTEVTANFDSVVLMKVNRQLVRQLTGLEAEGIKSRMTYVRRATTAREKVVRDLEDITEEDLDYFSILILRPDQQDPADKLEDT